MARIRTIKPEFFTSADIACMTPLARLFYIALWCEADREGRLVWNVKTFKLRYFPADNCDPNELADELIGAGLVVLYEVDGKQYAEIPSFKRHQVINNRESESSLPPRVKDASPRVLGEGRKEGRKGKEPASVTRERFEEFWDAYPRKRSKGQAEKAWSKLKPDEQLHDRIMRAVEQAKTSVEWTKDNGQFIPYPSSWLNAKGWEDEMDEEESSYAAGAI